jgi:glycosyltransferase involved in cell wall biosynthesis
MRKVEESILAPAVADARIIPYGIDLSVFCPADKRSARMTLGIPLGATVLLFSANGIRRNVWKDYETLRTAVTRVAARRRPENVIFIALGEDGPSEYVGAGEIRFVPYTTDATVVARYCQAADIYLHAARAETFPLAVLEALACGTAVVATAVGGIPEQIKPLASCPGRGSAAFDGLNDQQATGVLVPPGGAEAMAYAIESLMDDEVLRRRLGENAAADARRRFDLKREADDYLAWYVDLLGRRETPRPATAEESTADAAAPVGVSA